MVLQETVVDDEFIKEMLQFKVTPSKGGLLELCSSSVVWFAEKMLGLDLAVWQVHRPGAEDVLDAIRLQDRYQTSFWDAMIIASAIQLGCQTIWSEDLSTGQVYDTVTVTSPF